MDIKENALSEAGWHSKKIAEIFESLHSSEYGLSKEEAERRLRKYGANKLPEAKVDGLAAIFLRQFQSPLIYILLAAAFTVLAIGQTIDGIIIFAVLVFNAVVGTIQEGKAQNTLLALKKFAETAATVVREGKETIIKDTDIAPGDIILLQEGEKVPADARIISANALKADEAGLTGESESVLKNISVLKTERLPVAERRNMVFKGTHIVSGSGKAVVVATGIGTEIGKIAQKITAIDTELPLKANIRHLSRLIIITVFIITSLLVILGVAYGKSVKEMFTTAVALSVSIIPEGLPIVMTLVLATGVWRMSRRNVLVKKLQAVEALGQTRVIAVDKTGTLTKNEMIIQKVYADKKYFEVGGLGYEPKGEIYFENRIVEHLNHPELILMGKIAAFCANARLSFLEETNTWKIAGDPTEAAMLVFSQKIGFHKNILEQEDSLISEQHFDYSCKYHAVVRGVKGKNFLSVVGAPERVLALCPKVWHKGKSEIFAPDEKKETESIFFSMAKQGFRVVACAINSDVAGTFNPKTPPRLTFVGFLAMKDALRPEVALAMKKVNSAGMRVVMITGDHRLTAEAIAKEVGIYRDGDTTLIGEDIDKMNDDVLAEKLVRATVFARVTPEHKLRIVQAYRKRGEIVAMTGDGVNDAPSLVAADLGVAMGKIGTEVAKEAADIVLLDDNFGGIVSAAEEGRSIYKTIKKVTLYLFSTSLGEVFVITGAIVLSYPLPILPAQIIWLNFVTDGFLDVALAMEPKEEGLLRGYFERPKKYLIDNLMAKRMFLMAVPMMVGTILLFKEYFAEDMTKALTVSLTTLAVFQWFNAWNCRSEEKSIFQTNPFSNKFLFGAIIAVILLQLSAVYLPFMQKVLRTAPLDFSDWVKIIAIAFSIVVVEELRKFFARRKSSITIGAG